MDKRQLKNNKLIFFIFSLLLVSMVTTPTKAINDGELRRTIEEKNREIQKLESEIKNYQEQIDKAVATSRTLRGDIQRFDNEIKKLDTDVLLTQTKIEKKELEIRELGFDIDETKQSIAERQEILKKILREVNEVDSKSDIELLFQYDSFTEFLDLLETTRVLGSRIRDNYEYLLDVKMTFESQKAKAEDIKSQLIALKNGLVDQRILREERKSEKKKLLAITKNQETLYQKLYKERDRQRVELLQEIQDIENELRRRADPSSVPTARQGLLAWPLKGNISLTQNSGITPFSQILYNGKEHNGIDLAAAIGTPVYSADRGVVLETGNTDVFSGCLSYGKWILVRHENNLATLYAHLSLIRAAKGDIVARGQLIGYTGSTGYATGPHLHLTVYNVQTIYFGSTKKGFCKFLPFGAYLNPLAYL